MKSTLKIVYRLASGILVLLVCVLGFAYVYSSYFAEYKDKLPAYGSPETASPRDWAVDDPNRVRILAIDGGALLGISELEILRAIEEKSGKQVHELFDFVSGSSTGAIAGTLLLAPKDQTGTPRTAADAIDIYQKFAAGVMERPIHHQVVTAYGLFGPFFVNDGRVSAAKELFGDAVFADLVRPAMFPGFVQNDRAMRFFRNWEDQNGNLLLASLLSAVTSAEIMFPAIELNGYHEGDIVVSDPAIILASPAHIAYIKAREEQPEATEFVVVTVSSDYPSGINTDLQFHGGLARWYLPLAEMDFEGQKSVSQQALASHSRYDSNVSITNYRLAPNMAGTSVWNADAENLDAIRAAGQAFVTENDTLLEQVVRDLDPGN